jgi:hypothetical protein
MTFRLCDSHSEGWTDNVKLFRQNLVILSITLFPLCSGLIEHLGVGSYKCYSCSFRVDVSVGSPSCRDDIIGQYTFGGSFWKYSHSMKTVVEVFVILEARLS